MATPPKRPNVLIGLGAAFVVLGLLALPLLLANPEGATGRGIPYWFAIPGLWVGGVGFLIYGTYWRLRTTRRAAAPPEEA